jgi:REP element-mobilizing transposase RayT
VELVGGIYHVVARGNERKAVFRDDVDRRSYLARLAACSSRYRFRVIAYCLMDNHVHLALERGPVVLSRIMLTLQSAYAQYFNRRHQRVGHLFQGRYKAFLVQDECYLLSLVRYIHMNPVRASLIKSPEAYRWSTDRFYRGRSNPDWLAVDTVLSKLAQNRTQACAAYRRLMAAREEQSYDDVPTFLGSIRGERTFADRALAVIGERSPIPSQTAESVACVIAKAEGHSLERMRSGGRAPLLSRARLIAAYLGTREAGVSIAAMARCLRREESTFNRGVHRLEESMARDPILRARVESLSGVLRRTLNTGIHD